ncbi:MAG: hypothetical protein ACK5PB_10045 [Pirellula sp.]|jgi:hypothetical protein
MVRIVTILLSVICAAEQVFSQGPIEVICLKRGPDKSCLDVYGARNNGPLCNPSPCTPSLAGGNGWGCSLLLLGYSPVKSEDVWDAKVPTYETPVSPDSGKLAEVLSSHTCYEAMPCSFCYYDEANFTSYCTANYETILDVGWTLYLLKDTDCPGVNAGGPM